MLGSDEVVIQERSFYAREFQCLLRERGERV